MQIWGNIQAEFLRTMTWVPCLFLDFWTHRAWIGFRGTTEDTMLYTCVGLEDAIEHRVLAAAPAHFELHAPEQVESE